MASPAQSEFGRAGGARRIPGAPEVPARYQYLAGQTRRDATRGALPPGYRYPAQRGPGQGLAKARPGTSTRRAGAEHESLPQVTLSPLRNPPSRPTAARSYCTSVSLIITSNVHTRRILLHVHDKFRFTVRSRNFELLTDAASSPYRTAGPVLSDVCVCVPPSCAGHGRSASDLAP